MLERDGWVINPPVLIVRVCLSPQSNPEAKFTALNSSQNGGCNKKRKDKGKATSPIITLLHSFTLNQFKRKIWSLIFRPKPTETLNATVFILVSNAGEVWHQSPRLVATKGDRVVVRLSIAGRSTDVEHPETFVTVHWKPKQSHSEIRSDWQCGRIDWQPKNRILITKSSGQVQQVNTTNVRTSQINIPPEFCFKSTFHLKVQSTNLIIDSLVQLFSIQLITHPATLQKDTHKFSFEIQQNVAMLPTDAEESRGAVSLDADCRGVCLLCADKIRRSFADEPSRWVTVRVLPVS